MKNKLALQTVFLTPAMVVLAILALVPTVYAIVISFQDRELSRPDGRFIGFANYISLFSDRRFLNSIQVSLTWEVLTVTATLVIAVGLGILLFECASPKARNVLSLLFLMPVILPRVSAAFVWKFRLQSL